MSLSFLSSSSSSNRYPTRPVNPTPAALLKYVSIADLADKYVVAPVILLAPIACILGFLEEISDLASAIVLNAVRYDSAWNDTKLPTNGALLIIFIASGILSYVG